MGIQTRSRDAKRIVLVEDEGALSLLLESALGEHGYGHELVICKTGEQAVDALEEQDCDIVVTDLRVPGKIDGLDLIKWLRRRAFEMPIVVMTAYSSPDVLRDLRYLEIDTLVRKPFDLDNMVDLISSYLAAPARQLATA